MYFMLKADIERKNYKTLYPININFEAASLAWKENKIDLGGGTFMYKKRTLNKFPKKTPKTSKKK